LARESVLVNRRRQLRAGKHRLLATTASIRRNTLKAIPTYRGLRARFLAECVRPFSEDQGMAPLR
jgi:hypothetical protein